MIKMVQILDFSTIFNEKPKELESYIEGVDKQILLKASCYFSRLKIANINTEKLLSDWFQAGNQEFLNQIYARIREVGKDRDVSIINTSSSLKFFEFVIDESQSSSVTKDQLESEICIFKLYLLLNEIYNKKDNSVSKTTDSLDTECKYEAMSFTNSFYDTDLINYNIFKSIVCQFQKAYLLFDELEKQEDYTDLLQKFYAHFNVNGWKEYLKKILPLIFQITKSTSKGNIEINIEKDETYDSNCDFLEKFAFIDSEIVGEDIDFLKIRSKPIVKIENGKYIVINDILLSERLFKGLYFCLNDLNQGLKKPIKNLKSKYCDWFSEKRLLYSVLNYTFENKFQKFTGEQLKEKGLLAEPDYYIRNRNKVILFESKDILIPAVIKTSANFVKLKKAFRKKLYFEANHKKYKIEPKAVLQLVRNIEKLLDKKDFIDIDSELENKILSIYPVLVLHDNLYNASGLNKLVNYWFNHELKKLKKKGFNINKVRPLVILDIDTMIYVQEAIKNSMTGYEKFIDDYLKVVNFTRKKVKSKEQAILLVKQSIISFSNFLEKQSIIQKNWKLPAQFLEFGKKLFSPSVSDDVNITGTLEIDDEL